MLTTICIFLFTYLLYWKKNTFLLNFIQISLNPNTRIKSLYFKISLESIQHICQKKTDLKSIRIFLNLDLPVDKVKMEICQAFYWVPNQYFFKWFFLGWCPEASWATITKSIQKKIRHAKKNLWESSWTEECPRINGYRHQTKIIGTWRL